MSQRQVLEVSRSRLNPSSPRQTEPVPPRAPSHGAQLRPRRHRPPQRGEAALVEVLGRWESRGQCGVPSRGCARSSLVPQPCARCPFARPGRAKRKTCLV